MSSEYWYCSFRLATQKLHLEACFASAPYNRKAERVFQEVAHLFASEELQQRLKDKRGCRSR
ncbi:hypothetical protein ACQ4M3_04570 [Leptolyngbya sp. AN03gr2]|uniref:hypothetical protein n=1 Tax=unclassified Leptolyngbya TaxID=2650499 RepID=UPI003D30FBC1